MAGPITYTLAIDGQPAQTALLEAVQELQVEDHADLADVARLKLSTAVAGATRAWTIVDDPLCARLANVRIGVRMGADQAISLIDGYVIDVRAALSSDPAKSVVAVVAMDATVLMDLEEKVRPWPDQSDSAIAETIFGEYGFDADVELSDPVRAQDEVTTIQRSTDIRFLRKLAERNGCECFLEVGAGGRTTGHFHPPRLEQDAQAVLSVNLGSETNVDDFQARYDMLSATTAAVTGLDVADASDQAAHAPTGSQRTLGAQSSVGGDRPRVRLLSQTGLSQAGELQTLAQAHVDRSAYAITATGDVNGSALGQVLRAKQPVLVRGAGGQFSGQYYVQSVLHRFVGPGYLQRVRLQRNAAGLTRSERFRSDDALPSQPAVAI